MIDREMVIMRGYPGSGKSTYINKYFPDAVVCSADLHMVDLAGNYDFQPEKLGYAHKSCRNDAREALVAGETLIVIDNTNTRLREYKDYLKLARTYGYHVRFVRMDTPVDVAASRNTHGVPHATVERMAGRMDQVPQGYHEKVVSGTVTD